MRSLVDLATQIRRTPGSQKPKPKLPAKSSGRAVSTRRGHVLLVDDDISILLAIASLLEAEGFRVSRGQSTADAVRLVHENEDIRLIISDFHLLEGESGTDAIAAVRNIRANLGAVLLSGDMPGALAAATKGVEISVASKPVNPEKLLALIARLMGRRALVT